MQLNQDVSNFKFKLSDISEKYEVLKSGEQIKEQDLERWQSQYNSMRDKFLRLQRDKENTDQQSQKEREEF